jgi:outer membrane protein
VTALARSKLKSDLDLSFANVNLAQATLLQLDAENNDQAALANLSAVLGYPALQNFELVEDTDPLAAPPGNPTQLITDALSMRLELLAVDCQSEAADKLHAAEQDELFPTISALG